MKRAPRPGILLVATRELRWMRRDGLALFLVIGVPVIAFALLAFTFSNAVIRNLRVSIVDADRTPTSMTYVQAIGSAPGVKVAERSDDLQGAMHAIRSGVAIAAIYIPPDFERDLWRESAPRSSRFTTANILRRAIAPRAPLRMPSTPPRAWSLLRAALPLRRDFWPSSSMFLQIQP